MNSISRFFKTETCWKGANPHENGGSAVSRPILQQRRALPIHPALFAAFPLLALYVHNMHQIPIQDLAQPLGIALLGTLCVWALFLLLTRHLRKAALAASAVDVVFFSYGHFRNFLPESLHWLITPVCALALLGLLFFILKTRSPLLDATVVLNLAALVLVAPSGWEISANLWHTSHSAGTLSQKVANVSQHTPSSTVKSPRSISLPPSEAANLPDIYYIILDAYGRDDRLQQFYGYDNTPFLKALEQRGFYIARHSGANYDQTPLCLASALTMNYLDESGKGLGPESLRQKVDENAVVACLRPFGYSYINIWSGMELSRVATADLVLNGKSDTSTFAGQAFGLTALSAISRTTHSGFDRHRERLQGVFHSLQTVARQPAPKFVFAHLLAPHPPFVFGANGEAVDPDGPFTLDDASWLLKRITPEQYKSRYVAQLQYVNRCVLEAVDAILQQSARPPIILLQGDHGSRMTLDWESLANTDLREPFSILNAYYVPKKVRADLYDTITPVNSFRILLTDLFDANYPRLPDRSFYSTAAHPYDFTEVTELVTGEKSASPSGRAH